MQTNVPHIYAVGDVTGKAALVYAATMEGKVAGLHAAGKRETKMNYDLVSNIIFSHPEIGTVGLTEAEAKAQGLDVITVKTPMDYIGKAVAIGEIDGLRKDDRRATFRTHRWFTYPWTSCNRYYADRAATPLSQRHRF